MLLVGNLTVKLEKIEEKGPELFHRTLSVSRDGDQEQIEVTQIHVI